MTQKPLSRAVITATLPSGRSIKLRELSGNDELNAAREAPPGEGMDSRLVASWAMILRSIVELDGEPFDQSEFTAYTIRDAFSSRDWRCVRELFDMLHAMDEDDVESFRRGAKLTIESAG